MRNKWSLVVRNFQSFFYSDSEDLVRFMVAWQQEYHQTDASLGGSSTTSSWPANNTWPDSISIHARRMHSATLHIDRQRDAIHLFDQDNLAANYYAPFIDVLIPMQAERIVAGVGNFALLAAKLTGTDSLYTSTNWKRGALVRVNWILDKRVRMLPSFQSPRYARYHRKQRRARHA